MDSQSEISILHLLPHVGGGVGTVVRAIAQNMRAYNITPFIATLESLNLPTKNWCVNQKIHYLENAWENKIELYRLINYCDIVHFHWWNHPLLQALITTGTLPKMRSVLWSHVNGLYAPQIFYPALIRFPDFFVISTPYSIESPLISNANTKNIKLIQSNAGLPSDLRELLPKPEIFQAGYIGTVDYCKMHRDLISIWHDTRITESPLIVCGGPSDAEFYQETKALGVSHLFDIRGMIDNVGEVLSNLHVFVYPLNRTHYGTGEQVLLEAMAYGAVPVVLNNGCENALVKNGKTGIVASNKTEFVRAIRSLRNNRETREKMADAGFDYVTKHFKIEQTVDQWRTIYNEAIQLPKRSQRVTLKPFININVNSPMSLLINSYGDSPESGILLSLLNGSKKPSLNNTLNFLSPTCFSKTRGSPFHYYDTFPEDKNLKKVCYKLKEYIPSNSI